jgi:hypothetical protein
VDDQPGGNGAAAWLAGIAVQDLLAREELVLLDRPTATWIAGGVTPEAVVVAEAVVDALGPPYGMWLVVATSLVVWRWGDRAAAMRVIVAAVLTAALAVALASVLPTSVDGTRFPGIAVSWLTATLVVAVPAVAMQHIQGAIRLAGAGAVVLVVAALAELVAGDAALPGVIGGIGGWRLVAAGGELTARTLHDRGQTSTMAGPRGT